MVRRYSCYARLLALVSALPWATLLIDRRAVADAPVGTTPGILTACDNPAVITAVSDDRKPTAKRGFLGWDGTAAPVALRTPLIPARSASPAGLDPRQIAHPNHSSCAFLCRFLI